MHGAMRNVHTIFVGKPEMKKPLGRPWHRWKIILNRFLKK
jgi:hypothetical protein